MKEALALATVTSGWQQLPNLVDQRVQCRELQSLTKASPKSHQNLMIERAHQTTIHEVRGH